MRLLIMPVPVKWRKSQGMGIWFLESRGVPTERKHLGVVGYDSTNKRWWWRVDSSAGKFSETNTKESAMATVEKFYGIMEAT